MWNKLLLALMAASCLSSCYKMPDDDYMSVVPMTNNPNVIPQKGGNALTPNVSY